MSAIPVTVADGAIIYWNRLAPSVASCIVVALYIVEFIHRVLVKLPLDILSDCLQVNLHNWQTHLLLSSFLAIWSVHYRMAQKPGTVTPLRTVVAYAAISVSMVALSWLYFLL